MSNNKFLITQSLLGSWEYCLSSGNLDEFASYLKRERKPPTKAMLDGIQFEDMVQAACNGHPPDKSHKWYEGIMETSDIVGGGAYQVRASSEKNINGTQFVLYGIFDFLKSGIIYDTKFSKRYRLNKYLNSPQHPMYFELCPEAREFQYIISDGAYVYREKYTRDDIPQTIENIIGHFMAWLKQFGLIDLYTQNWQSKY